MNDKDIIVITEDNCKITPYNVADYLDEERIPAAVINRLYLDKENPLRVWREYRGFSGRKLAEAVGISSAYLSDIENGKKDGSISVLKRIAEVLRVDVDEII